MKYILTGISPCHPQGLAFPRSHRGSENENVLTGCSFDSSQWVGPGGPRSERSKMVAVVSDTVER